MEAYPLMIVKGLGWIADSGPDAWSDFMERVLLPYG
jgi:hypothetical protein